MISPLLSNIYLTEVDGMLEAGRRRPRRYGKYLPMSNTQDSLTTFGDA